MKIAVIRDNIIKTGEHQVIFPNVSFPPSGPSDQWLEENGVKKINAFKPYDQRTQKLVRVDPYLEGDWVYIVKVMDKSPEELSLDRESQAMNIRSTRNKLLSDSDWTQVADAPVDKPAWAEYRQSLRNISEQEGFPWNVEWPRAPGVQILGE